jgi:hypothetical protein
MNKQRIIDMYLVYLMHRANADQEGMDSAMYNILSEVEMDIPESFSLKEQSEEWKRQCPKCKEWWSDLGYEDGKVVIYGECGHKWDGIKKPNVI